MAKLHIALFSVMVLVSACNGRKVDRVVWSFDNKSAMVAVVDTDRRDLPDGHYSLWLTDSHLTPVKCLLGTTEKTISIAFGFSRDDKFAYFSLPMSGDLAYSDGIRQYSVADGAFTDMVTGGVKFLPEYLGCDLSNRLFMTCKPFPSRSFPPGQVYRCAGGGLFPLFSGDLLTSSATISAVVVDGAHRTCDVAGASLFRTRGRWGDKNLYETRLQVGLDGNTSSTTVEAADTDVRARNATSSIMVFAYGIGSDGKSLYKMQFSGGSELTGVRAFRLDRTEIAWIDSSTDCVHLADETGKEILVLEHIPEGVTSIVGFNESIGVVCLQGKDRLYVYDIKTGNMLERPFDLFSAEKAKH